MQVGFCVLVREGHAELQFFGQQPNAARSLVNHAEHGGRHAVLLGRLTYRAELLQRLPRDEHQLDRVDDAWLALAAYRHWGAAGLARLEGTFALVIWDAARRVVVGLRDALGGYPLFWTETANGFAISTCMRPLLALLPRRRLNLDYVAEFLAAPGTWVKEVLTEDCPYEGIGRVLPGSTLQYQMDGPVAQQTHWSWLDHEIDPGTNRLEELSALTTDVLRRAVRENLRGRVAAHVSGGIDSSSIALLARDGLRAAQGQPAVHGISAVFEYRGGLARETPYVEAVLRQPGIVGHVVNCDEVLDYDCFANPPQHDEPCAKLPLIGIQARLVEAAAAAGADTLLTGDGGDMLFDILPYHLTDLLRRGRLLKAWKTARAWGRADNTSAWRYLWHFGLCNLVPAALRAGPRAFWHGGHVTWDRQGPGTIVPWVRPEFARAHGLRERMLAQIRAERYAGQPMNVGFLLAALRTSSGDAVRWSLAAPHGMTLIHPFFDPRVVGLCLGIQRRFRQRPEAPKELLLHALRGVLPEKVRGRRFKSDYNALNQEGLSRNLLLLETLVRQAPDELGLFDKDVLLRCLREMPHGRVTAHLALSRMHMTLAFLRWMSMQEQWQSPPTPIAKMVLNGPNYPDLSRGGRHADRLATAS
jgi:asparagine synthase (glutamine-hydrolysing)